MRTHRLTIYLQAHEACSLIEFLDQVREVLMQAYGDDITAMLQQATASQQHESGELLGDGESF
jgi:hypothetical protein